MTADTFLALFALPAMLFVLWYIPAVERLSRRLVSPYGKADVRKRLFAAGTDGLLVATSGILYHTQVCCFHLYSS